MDIYAELDGDVSDNQNQGCQVSGHLGDVKFKNRRKYGHVITSGIFMVFYLNMKLLIEKQNLYMAIVIVIAQINICWTIRYER
jgi:hypothetical protein